MPPEVEEWMKASIQDSMRRGAVVHGKNPDLVNSIEARSLRVPTLSSRELKILSAKQLKQRSLQLMNKPSVSRQIVDSTLANLIAAKTRKNDQKSKQGVGKTVVLASSGQQPDSLSNQIQLVESPAGQQGGYSIGFLDRKWLEMPIEKETYTIRVGTSTQRLRDLLINNRL